MPLKAKTKPVIRLRYEEVADNLQKQITTGAFAPGDRLPTLRELQRSYGVTQATIDRALAILEKKTLITRSHRSGLFVAKRPQKSSAGLIGFCGVGFTQTDFSAYWTRVIEGVEAAARENDAQIVLLNNESPAGWDKVDGLLLNAFDAIIPASYVPPELPIVSFFAPATIKGIARERARVAKHSSTVLIDDYAGTRSATEHLLSLGHRRIAYLNNSRRSHRFYSVRLAGYQQALQDAGIVPDPRWLRALPIATSSLYFMNSGREGMRQWLRDDWNDLGCTALLVHNDDAAWGVVDVLREEGIGVPGDVSVVGFDGTEGSECCNPQLTTVEVPLRDMGRAGVELLWQQIHDGTESKEVVLPTLLRVRASTAPSA
jgi:DNA-binding LacI/PurR family transcriptional regulator